MNALQAVLFLAAIILFVIAALPINSRVNLLAVGLAFGFAGLAVPVFHAVLR